MKEAELVAIGFGEKQAALYLALLEAGRGTAAELAHAAGIKRTTAYDILSELEAKNLVAVTFSGNRRVFAAEPPENLEQVVARQKQVFDRLLPGLNDLFYRHDNRPRVRYYAGVEGIRYVNEEVLKVKSGEYFYFGSMQSFVDTLGMEYLESYVRRRVRKKIWSNALRIRSQEIDDPLAASGDANYRRVRYLTRSLNEDMATLTLFDGKIAVCTSAREGYGMIIESGEMHAILKLVWDCLWAVAEE